MLVAMLTGTGVLVGSAGLVFDAGSLLYEQSQLQNGAFNGNFPPVTSQLLPAYRPNRLYPDRDRSGVRDLGAADVALAKYKDYE
jgi:hypothetical protein